ncbi:hypothetical protein [Paenibacillus sp. NPDC058174]|uniref:hypothetical protein n=1 Tax=Paenibacillus sp. NPDC058174 TaxID=3346366 RepID=UPI0036DF0F89
MQRSVSPAAKYMVAFLLAAAFLLNAAILPAGAAAKSETAAEYGIFLKDKYNLTVAPKATKGDFIQYTAAILGNPKADKEVAFTDIAATDPLYASAAALHGKGILGGTTVEPKQPLKPLVAALISLRAANLQELALTYPKDKVDKALVKLGVSTKSVTGTTAQELAAAVDTGLIPTDFYGEFKTNAAASTALTQALLGKVLTINGKYKQYIGYVSDADIYSKFYTAYTTSNIIQIPKLQEVVDRALKQDIVTGYNLKDSRFDANFVESLSVTYGHSNVKHALQLIGLLRSEGIDAKVQFEPKTSAFIHMKEWGTPTIDDTNQAVLTENGNYINYAKEYDIKFEFANTIDKVKFDKMIWSYAKKDVAGQKGLIAGSWFQPLYYSLTKTEGYKEIANNKIVDGHYYAQTFSLPDKTDAIAKGFATVDPSVKVTTYTFWVDGPFFNYLNGEGL